MRQALHCLAFLLLPGLSPEATQARTRPRPGVPIMNDWRAQEAAPYLPVLGSLGLRFREPEFVPEPAVRTVAVGPPVPGLSAKEAVVSVANAVALQATIAGPAPKAPLATPGQTTTPKGEPAPAVPAPPSAVLPDDSQPQVRAEDFLPYFQLPGAPRPAPLPPSSATYTQTPK